MFFSRVKNYTDLPTDSNALDVGSEDIFYSVCQYVMGKTSNPPCKYSFVSTSKFNGEMLTLFQLDDCVSRLNSAGQNQDLYFIISAVTFRS